MIIYFSIFVLYSVFIVLNCGYKKKLRRACKRDPAQLTGAQAMLVADDSTALLSPTLIEEMITDTTMELPIEELPGAQPVAAATVLRRETATCSVSPICITRPYAVSLASEPGSYQLAPGGFCGSRVSRFKGA